MFRLDAALVGGRDPSFGQRDDPVDGRKQLMGGAELHATWTWCTYPVVAVR